MPNRRWKNKVVKVGNGAAAANNQAQAVRVAEPCASGKRAQRSRRFSADISANQTEGTTRSAVYLSAPRRYNPRAVRRRPTPYATLQERCCCSARLLVGERGGAQPAVHPTAAQPALYILVAPNEAFFILRTVSRQQYAHARTYSDSHERHR